ncbi:MAG TPA: phage holin family protein [Verrucomicrobiales bacterium]|nr:phage holin family protein [Verrucomicrobiales bacterium]
MMHRTLPGAGQSPELSRPQEPNIRSRATVTELFRDLRDDVALLVRQQTALLRVEMRGKAVEAAKDGGLVVAGLVGVSAGMFALIATVSALLAWLFQHWGWSASAAWSGALALTATGTLSGGSALAYWGMTRLKRRTLIPEESLQSLNDNKEWLWRHIH